MATPVTPVGYSTPYTSSTTQDSGLGAAAAPYGQDVLAQSYALASQDPYHAYTGQTVAGPTGLQQTAADSVSGLNAGALAQQGTALTQKGANYTPTNATFDQSAATQYMNPYQQNVTDIANREAGRQSDIQGVQQAGQAAQAGAFGGSRQGVVDAERQRTLAMVQNNNEVQGQAAAYANAQQQFNADQTRNQQAGQFASQAALAGGNALTGQGAQAFGQQEVAGGQQQAQAQGALTQAQQNFQGQVQHPYDQLNFMTNQIKAMPGQSTSTSTTYTPYNTANQQSGVGQAADTIGGIAGALGAGKNLWSTVSGLFGFAKGGAVPSAAVRAGLPEARIAQLYGKM